VGQRARRAASSKRAGKPERKKSRHPTRDVRPRCAGTSDWYDGSFGGVRARRGPSVRERRQFSGYVQLTCRNGSQAGAAAARASFAPVTTPRPMSPSLLTGAPPIQDVPQWRLAYRTLLTPGPQRVRTDGVFTLAACPEAQGSSSEAPGVRANRPCHRGTAKTSSRSSEDTGGPAGHR